MKWEAQEPGIRRRIAEIRRPHSRPSKGFRKHLRKEKSRIRRMMLLDMGARAHVAYLERKRREDEERLEQLCNKRLLDAERLHEQEHRGWRPR